MQKLFDLALARLDRASTKLNEFGEEWGAFIDRHPWKIELYSTEPTEFEFRAVMREEAPAVLSLIFSEWLSHVRAALDNGLYAWAATLARQDPPPDSGSLQFPIANSHSEFAQQAKRLKSLPQDVVDALAKVQPFQSPEGPKSNLLYWMGELSRTDRHRKPHVGIGRVAEHTVKIQVPHDVKVSFKSVQPFQAIDGSVALCRFSTDRPISRSELSGDFRGVGIDPEISSWAEFRLSGKSVPLEHRMRYSQFFMRAHIENMASLAGIVPSGGFEAIEA